MNNLSAAVEAFDRWQQSHRSVAILFGVAKKFGDDRANQYVVALGWYGFVSIYPLLLVVVTVLGFIGAASLGHQLVTTLHQFPVVGSEFNPAHQSNSLHGSTLGLVIGLVVLLYGAQGVTQTAQQSMAGVWNIPEGEVPGLLERLVRSLGGLAIIGGTFVVNAVLATLATGSGHGALIGALIVVGMALVNLVLYVAAFRVLTPSAVPLRALVPGGAVSAVGFTLLITLGSGLIQHQLRNTSATYGQFGVVIGLVTFLFLLAKITLYGAELNPVLHRRLWPRSIRSAEPTRAETQAGQDSSHRNLRRTEEPVGGAT